MASERKDKEGGKSSAASGKDGEYEFIPPDFDEDAFIHREMVSFRTTTILFLWGIVAALVSWAAFAGMDGRQSGWFVGLLVCAAFGVSLKWLFPLFKADVKHFGRREWLGTGSLFFFTWLAFFLIAVNPPLSDFAAPRVSVFASPDGQAPGHHMAVHLFVEDNVKVESHSLRLLSGADVLATESNLTSLGRGHYRLDVAGLTPGTYRVEAEAADARGHTGEGAVEFAVSEGLVSFDAPGADNVLAGPADRVLVTTADGLEACRVSKGGTVKTRDPCVRTVRLELASGSNITLSYDKDALGEDRGAWTGTTDLAGWTVGNNTLDVVAEMADRWVGSIRFDGGAIRDGPHSVQVSGTIGTDVVEPAKDPNAPQREVPGPSLALLALGLLAAVLLARRRA